MYRYITYLLCFQYTCTVLKTQIAFHNQLVFVRAFAEVQILFAKCVSRKCIAMQIKYGAFTMHFKCVNIQLGAFIPPLIHLQYIVKIKSNPPAPPPPHHHQHHHHHHFIIIIIIIIKSMLRRGAVENIYHIIQGIRSCRLL